MMILRSLLLDFHEIPVKQLFKQTFLKKLILLVLQSGIGEILKNKFSYVRYYTKHIICSDYPRIDRQKLYWRCRMIVNKYFS